MANGLGPRIRVTAPTGITVSATLAGETVQATETSTGVYDMDVKKLGPWVVTGDKSGTTATATVDVDDVGLFEGELSFVSSVLNENDWATISAVSQAGNGDDYWDVGDAKEITVNGKVGNFLTLENQKMYPFIIDFNHADNGVATNGILWMLGKSAISDGVVVGLFDGKYWTGLSGITDGTKCFTMNHWGNYNYGGWKGCDLRYDILGAVGTAPSGYGSAKTTSCVGYDATETVFSNPKADTLMAALPSDLRATMQIRIHYVDNVGNQSNAAVNVTSVADGMSPLAEFEVFGITEYANQYEKEKQTQVAYYANGAEKKVYRYNATDTAVTVWECSPARDYAGAFCLNKGGGASAGMAYYAFGLTPTFLT